MTNIVPVTTGAAVQTEAAADPWGAAAVDWLANLSSKCTRRAYRTAWRSFFAFSALHPAAVTKHDVIGYRNHMADQGYAPATIAAHLSALSSFYKFVLDGRLPLPDGNPVAGVKWPKVAPYADVKAPVSKLIEDNGDLELLASIDAASPTGRRDRAIILLLLAHGLRVGEIGQLYAADYDGRYLRVLRKGADSKTAVALAPEVITAVTAYLETRGKLGDGAPLFVATPQGRAAAAALHGEYTERPLTGRAIRAMLTRRCNRVFGMGHGIGPHTLRHALATRADYSGAALGDISALLGHKSTRITHTYLTSIGGRGDALARQLSSRYAAAETSR
jgi:site-specific recombinase XerD